jgi:hypothetical protein
MSNIHRQFGHNGRCELRAPVAHKPGRGNMAQDDNTAQGDNDIPLMQKILDNHFLLLFLGVTIPAVLYTVWGIVDIMSIPLAK